MSVIAQGKCFRCIGKLRLLRSAIAAEAGPTGPQIDDAVCKLLRFCGSFRASIGSKLSDATNPHSSAFRQATINLLSKTLAL